MSALSAKLQMAKANWVVLAAAMAWIASAIVAESAEPFHLSLIGYQQLSDGSYRFSLHLDDVPRPHVTWPGQTDPQYKLWKIGDTLGHYRIVGFTKKIKPAQGEMFFDADVSELQIEQINKPSEKVTLVFRLVYNVPEARIDEPQK